jgi:thymidylate synthase (FAD)
MLVAHTPNPEEVIAKAARTVYDKDDMQEYGPEADARLIRKLISLEHMSPLEHATVTFKIFNTSWACTQQLLRHRLCSFVVRSLRRTIIDPNHIIWPQSLQSEEARKIWTDAVCNVLDAYTALVKSGIPKEDARYIVPMGIPTTTCMTANMRELRLIMLLRGEEHAQMEIRMIACYIYRLLKRIAPSVVDDIIEEPNYILRKV